MRRFRIPKRYRPTNKWWVGTVTAAGTLVTLGIESGIKRSFSIAIVGFCTQRVCTYLTRDEDPQT